MAKKLETGSNLNHTVDQFNGTYNCHRSHEHCLAGRVHSIPEGSAAMVECNMKFELGKGKPVAFLGDPCYTWRRIGPAHLRCLISQRRLL